MAGQENEDEVAGARAYEELHVPALFRQWCGRLLDRVDACPGDRVLDLACGTGILAREAAARVGATGRVCGLDPGPGMLTVARELGPGTEWREGVAESIPYEAASFDALVSQFGLMFFTDCERALSEMVRVLRPGGRLAVAVWESLENSQAYPIMVGLLEKLAGVDAASALRAPFALGDKAELERLFSEAGVEDLCVQTHPGTARFPSIRSMVEADLRGWLPIMGVVLSEDVIAAILEEAQSALDEFVTEGGAMEFDAPALIASGRKPADT